MKKDEKGNEWGGGLLWGRPVGEYMDLRRGLSDG